MALKLNPSIVTALALAASVAGWMATGTVVVSGVEDAKNALPPPAARTAADTEPFAVRVTRVHPVERRNVLEMRGRTAAEARVSVRAQTNAQIRERPVEKGDEVAEGDLLCQLWSGSREADLARAVAMREKAALDNEAATRLQGRGFETATRVATTKADLDAAEAEVAAAELELARTRIKAPIAGIIEEPLAEVGDYLNTGAVCATIVDIDPLLVTGQISERDIGRISQGARVEVRLVTGETATGTVAFIARTADPQTRTFTVEVTVDNPDGRLREGVTATAMIPEPPVTVHRLEPGYLTLADSGEVGVRAVDGNARVRFLPVELVSQDREGIWVAGLDGPVDVIIVGQDYVDEGQAVMPVHVSTGEQS